MLRFAIWGALGAALGVITWMLLRRPRSHAPADPKDQSHESFDIDPGMIITPPEVDSQMVVTPPDVDPRMVVTPRPRRDDEPPGAAEL
jgi:hypothetical protein